ncbi:MATE family efflux transporter [Nakamurella lactea]|uniref:MATE family efflux transporter n=1 Tax=Nakamurella lactea TaxID=459515 RepID=UPI00040630CC|nr:MATE family efflux transporter [Nakamurella lactea]
MTGPSNLNREIARLAVPALGALLAEPLFLLVDTAIVGHLGVAQLAGVGVGAIILTTAVGLSVFLAYGTTSQVARLLGAGDLRRALTLGMDGIYLAVGIGLVLGLLGLPTAGLLVRALGADPAAAQYGTSYLLWSLAGLPAMLVVLATTGVLRGLQDTSTPLVVAVIGAVLNVGLNLLLVLGFHWGVAGSAIGTAITQNAMAVALVVVVVRHARLHRASLRPDPRGIGGAGTAGVPLLIRTLALRIGILVTTYVAAGKGQQALAGHQVVSTVWNFLALGLDALAIAAQALTGKALGEGDARAARRITDAMVRWSLVAGAVVGVLILLVHPFVGRMFTPDPAVQHAIGLGLIVVAIAQPVAGYVFLLDGVLIGAGDGKYLAWTGMAAVLVYLPFALIVGVAAPDGAIGLLWLWIAYTGVYLVARAVFQGLRYRGDRWLVTGG